MRNSKLVFGVALASVLGLAACGGGEEGADMEATTSEVITETEMEEREIMVPTTDTSLVETEVQADIDTDIDTVDVPEGR